MIPLPDTLRNQIQEVVRTNSLKGEKGWRFSQEDEDTVLGHYLGNLITDKRSFNTIEKNYEWEIIYHKFRAKGKDALEKRIGADAIITLEIQDNISHHKTVKSVLFQAKKEWNRSGLAEQKRLMNRIARNGNFIFTCGPDGYFAKVQENDNSNIRVGDFLADKFIACRIGLEGMFYDETRKELIKKSTIKTDFEINHELVLAVSIESDKVKL